MKTEALRAPAQAPHREAASMLATVRLQLSSISTTIGQERLGIGIAGRLVMPVAHSRAVISASRLRYGMSP